MSAELDAAANKILLEGMLTNFPVERRQKIVACYEGLRTAVLQNGEDGLAALALVVAELSDKM